MGKPRVGSHNYSLFFWRRKNSPTFSSLLLRIINDCNHPSKKEERRDERTNEKTFPAFAPSLLHDIQQGKGRTDGGRGARMEEGKNSILRPLPPPPPSRSFILFLPLPPFLFPSPAKFLLPLLPLSHFLFSSQSPPHGLLLPQSLFFCSRPPPPPPPHIRDPTTAAFRPLGLPKRKGGGGGGASKTGPRGEGGETSFSKSTTTATAMEKSRLHFLILLCSWGSMAATQFPLTPLSFCSQTATTIWHRVEVPECQRWHFLPCSCILRWKEKNP